MLTLQCTQKLLAQMSIELSHLKDADPVALWHANLLQIDRRKCLLFMNDKTRYNFLVAGVKKPDYKHIGEIFLDALFRCMLNDGIGQKGVERVLDTCSNYCITKFSDRSVLGTMNDVADIAKHTILCSGGLNHTDISRLNMDNNRMPMKAINYGFSVDAFRDMVEG